MHLSETPQVPQNASALVIAGPRTQLLPGEIKAIESYLHEGGNLLWLVDQGPLYGLEKIAEMLGIEFHPGTIIDPNSQLVTGSAAAIVIANYGNHAIVKNLNTLTLYPTAIGINVEAPEGWRDATLIDSSDASWSELGPLHEAVQFDKGVDIPGPLNIAVTLTRHLEDEREQRVIVIGDGDFLSNTYLGNGGNLELSLSLVNWVSQDDAYVSIPIRTTVDSSLNLSRSSQIAIAVISLLLLPLTLTGSGIFIWLRRRKR